MPKRWRSVRTYLGALESGPSRGGALELNEPIESTHTWDSDVPTYPLSIDPWVQTSESHPNSSINPHANQTHPTQHV